MRAISIPQPELVALQRIEHRHLGRLGIFVVLYVGAAWGATWLAAHGQGVVPRLPLYVLAAASLHGVSLFTHEGVHGALAASPGLNRALAAVCAWPVLQNFAAYKVLHLRHHADLGGGRDPDHYANYTHRPWLVFLMNWGRLLLGYPAYITLIPILGWRHGTPADRRWIAFEVGAVVALVAAAIGSPLPRGVLLHGWLIPMLVINTMVNIRGMSQHTLLADASDEVRGTRTILANRLSAFFMCNENFHLEHHLFPRVPWYNLPRVHERVRDQLVAAGAPFIPSYLAFVRLFIASSFRRLDGQA